MLMENIVPESQADFYENVFTVGFSADERPRLQSGRGLKGSKTVGSNRQMCPGSRHLH